MPSDHKKRRKTRFESKTVFLPILLLAGSMASGRAVQDPQPAYDVQNTPEAIQAFNRALSYIKIEPESGGMGHIDLKPGMRLRLLHSLPILTNPETQLKNNHTPALAPYEWIIPSENGPFDNEDVYLLSYLVTLGLPVKKPETGNVVFNPTTGLDWLNNMTGMQQPGNDFFQSFATAKMATVLPTLSVLHKNPASNFTPHSPNFTAQKLRDWYTRPGSASYNDGAANKAQHWQTLQFNLPWKSGSPPDTTTTNLTVELFGLRGAPFFNNKDLASLPSINEYSTRNKYYVKNSNAYYPRVLIDADVPVQVHILGQTNGSFGAAREIYFPFYFSLSDVEKRMRVQVIAVRRRINYFPELKGDTRPADTDVSFVVTREAVEGTDGYFVLWFRKQLFGILPSYSAGSKSGAPLPVIKLPQHTLDDLLIAPGDVLICRGTYPPVAGSPELR